MRRAVPLLLLAFGACASMPVAKPRAGEVVVTKTKRPDCELVSALIVGEAVADKSDDAIVGTFELMTVFCNLHAFKTDPPICNIVESERVALRQYSDSLANQIGQLVVNGCTRENSDSPVSPVPQ